MAAPEAADVTDFLLRHVAGHLVMQRLLRPGAEAGGAVAKQHGLPRVLLFQEIVEGNGPQRQRIAEERLLAHPVNGIGNLGRAMRVRGLDHAGKDILIETFSKGESAEVFGHAAPASKTDRKLSAFPALPQMIDGPAGLKPRVQPCDLRISLASIAR